MGLKTELKSLVDELDRVHQGAAPWSEEVGLPEFVTTENGRERYFTRKSRETLERLSAILHENRPQNLLKIELEEFQKIVRQAVADMHAAEEFSGFDASDPDQLVPKLKSLVEDRLASIADEYMHYFPAWTLGMEQSSPFSLGPVSFWDRMD